MREANAPLKSLQRGASKVFIECAHGQYHVIDDEQLVSKHETFAEACWVKSVLERDRDIDESIELTRFESHYNTAQSSTLTQI